MRPAKPFSYHSATRGAFFLYNVAPKPIWVWDLCSRPFNWLLRRYLFLLSSIQLQIFFNIFSVPFNVFCPRRMEVAKALLKMRAKKSKWWQIIINTLWRHRYLGTKPKKGNFIRRPLLQVKESIIHQMIAKSRKEQKKRER